MTKDKQTWLGRNKDNLMLWVITGVLGFIILLIIDMRDFMKYQQPRVDEIQNENINSIHQFTCTVDSVNKERNVNSNKRIDKLHDDIIPLLQRIVITQDVMIDNNKNTLKKIDDKLKQLNELNLITSGNE